MNDPVDVLIIGAGASGAAVAWSLAETKMHILCLEQGGWMADPTPEQDWPAVRDCSEAAWKLALADLEATHAKLRGAVASLDAARLNEKVPGEAYSIYFMLHGVVQHNLYHAGQIAILRKP